MDCIVSRRPSWIGDKIKIDLTRDILGVSSTGYVIRIKCFDQEYALKRTHTMDEEPPDLARLKHPHVVDILHYWTEGRDEAELRPLFAAGVNEESGSSEESYLFLMMELMDGDLAQLMAEGKRAGVSPFSLPVAVDIMLQIARGMLYLHDETSVSYPQLKCANVLYKIVNKTDGEFLVGDVIVKLGGFGCSRPADMDSMKQDVLCFGMTCLEILTGDISKSSIPETTPAILRDCIVSCLDKGISFSEIVTTLAELVVMQSCEDEFLPTSESILDKILHTKAEDSCAEPSPSFTSDDKIFAVHQLHPVGDISIPVRATLIFFHGFHKVPEEWRRTWMTRDNKLVWPQAWLPEDLGEKNLRVLSVSFDANLRGNFNRFEIGKNLVQALVLSPTWKFGNNEERLFLVGHSFGGIIIKSLVTESKRFIYEGIRTNINFQEVMKCRTFLKGLKTIVFYSVPHPLTSGEFENYISECKNVFGLPRSSFLQSLWEDTQFIPDMLQLSKEFETAVSEEWLHVLAFLEGKPMAKNRVLFTKESKDPYISIVWDWHKIDKDNHFEVCRPDSKNHIGYKELKHHLQQYIKATVPSPRVESYQVHTLHGPFRCAKPIGVIIFIHGLSRGIKDWEDTWLTRGPRESQVCWPQAWLPEHFGEGVRVLAPAYDLNPHDTKDDVKEIGHKLLEKLISELRYYPSSPIILVGHSFGGLVIKSMICEAQNIGNQLYHTTLWYALEECQAFIKNLKGTVFYSVPHSGTSEDFVEFWTQFSRYSGVPNEERLAGIMKNLEAFSRQMQQLTEDYENHVPATMSTFNFFEGNFMPGTEYETARALDG